MSKNHLVSCIVPVYNGERFVAAAVESILAQTYRPIELLVVNDGSTDNTTKVLDKFGNQLQVVYQENAGQAAARNRGLDLAVGEFVAFLDADDIWLPEKLALQVEYLATHPEADLCNCLMENFWEQDLVDEAERLRETVHAKPYPATWQGLLVRREVFGRVGTLDTGVRYSDVREWLHRAKGMGITVGRLERVLVHRRIHSNNLSRGRGRLDPDLLLRMAQRSVARQRN